MSRDLGRRGRRGGQHICIGFVAKDGVVGVLSALRLSGARWLLSSSLRGCASFVCSDGLFDVIVGGADVDWVPDEVEEDLVRDTDVTVGEKFGKLAEFLAAVVDPSRGTGE